MIFGLELKPNLMSQFGQSWFDTKDVDKIEKFLKNDFSIKKVISLFAINHGL